MKTMIEQIAWVIAQAKCRGVLKHTVCSPVDEETAKAVLEKLLMPTDYMTQAAVWVLEDEDRLASATHQEIIDDIFKEMIQAALDQYIDGGFT